MIHFLIGFKGVHVCGVLLSSALLFDVSLVYKCLGSPVVFGVVEHLKIVTL